MGRVGEMGLDATFRAVTDLSSDSIFLLNRDHRIVYINRTAEGLSIDDAIGTVIFDLLTKDQAKIAREAFARARRTGEKTSYEITFPLPDGRLSRWVTRIGPKCDGGFVVVSSDVTAHATTRDELDLVFALSRDMMFVTGYNGWFQRVSPAAVDALGYSSEELVSRPFLEFVHPEDRESTRKVFAEVIEQTSDVKLFENRYLTKDGRTRLLQWTARPDPASCRVVAIARDVTESRAMEQQLRQSQKMDAVGQLAGGIAHDFNNLLQSIFGALDFAKTAKSCAEMLEHMQDIELAAERATELTRQLLSFSRQQPFSTAKVKVNELLKGTIKLLRRVLPATIEVRVLKERKTSPVIADRVQLEQALLNLCLNARDAMPQGGLLTLGVETLDLTEGPSERFYGVKAGKYVSLTVEDQGQGMTTAVRERMFEPFFTTKPTGQGTGLGMSMVYGAVTQHGGTIHVESQPHQGTKVQILLPAAPGDEPSSLEPSPNSSAQIMAGDGHILLAEDDPLVRRFCVRALEGAGYQVLAAENGAEAIALGRAHTDLDLALFDVIMPEVTGPEAYAALREVHPHLPVLFISGYADVSNLSHAVPESATILTKPLRISVLLAAVHEILDRASSY